MTCIEERARKHDAKSQDETNDIDPGICCFAIARLRSGDYMLLTVHLSKVKKGEYSVPLIAIQCQQPCADDPNNEA